MAAAGSVAAVVAVSEVAASFMAVVAAAAAVLEAGAITAGETSGAADSTRDLAAANLEAAVAAVSPTETSGAGISVAAPVRKSAIDPAWRRVLVKAAPARSFDPARIA